MRKAVALAVSTLVLAGCGDGDGGADATTGAEQPGRTAPATPSVPVPPTTTAPPTATTPSAEKVERPARPLWCPGGKDGAPPAAKRFDARELLGRTVADALALAREHACTVRVVRRDGKDLIRTMDYSSARINVDEQDGRVVALRGIA